MIAVIIKALLGYLLGSLSGSLLLGRLRGVDIRRHGSGNAGGTNALRTQGWWFALAVVIIDIGKGVLAAAWLPLLSLGQGPEPVSSASLALICGFAAIVGHCFPLYHGFRGGKGAATAVGVVAVVMPMGLIPMLSVWLLVLVLTGFVGLATMFAAAALVPAALMLAPGFQPMLWFCMAVAVFIVFTHRSNIANMRNGVEHRFEKVTLRHMLKK